MSVKNVKNSWVSWHSSHGIRRGQSNHPPFYGISRVMKSKETERVVVGKDTVDEEGEGSAFELTGWV